MWLVTKQGFFSVVAHQDDPNLVIVRGRCRDDLEQLHAIGSELVLDLDMPGIVDTPEADYCCQMFMERDIWELMAVTLAMDIDYQDFREAVVGDLKRQSAYLAIRQIMRVFQGEKAPPVLEEMQLPLMSGQGVAA